MCFLSNPKQSHKEAVKRIRRYLKSTKEKGIIYKFNSRKGIEVFLDADFAETWINSNSYEYRLSLLRIGCVIKIANYSILSISKIQTEVALLTTETEYITLLQSTRDWILIKNLIEFLCTFMKVNNKEIDTYSTLFEDNSGALQLVTEPRYCLRTKHICTKYYYF